MVLIDLPEVDVTDRDAFLSAMSQADPNLVIHCAALTDVDKCAREPRLAYQINGLGTQNAALACQKFDVPMLHLSTNEVFDGQRLEGYEEWMALNPANPYGRSKAAAESHVKDLLSRFYIVRSAWLFAQEGDNFVNKMLRLVGELKELEVVTTEVGSPTYAPDLAGAIARLIRYPVYGIYHLVNEGSAFEGRHG